MPSTLSTLNSTQTSLGVGGAFVGQGENVLNYTCCDITLATDQDTAITLWGSNDNTNWTPIYNTTATNVGGFVNFFETVLLYHQYYYVQLGNVGLNPQTYCRFATIFRQQSHIQAVVGGSGASTNVNVVSQSAGLALDSSLQTIITEINTGGYGTFWANVAAGTNATSSIVTATRTPQTISIFGNTSAATTLTLQYAIIGITPAWYDTQYSVAANGDFGFSIPCAFSSLRLKSSDPATISAYVVYK